MPRAWDGSRSRSRVPRVCEREREVCAADADTLALVTPDLPTVVEDDPEDDGGGGDVNDVDAGIIP